MPSAKESGRTTQSEFETAVIEVITELMHGPDPGPTIAVVADRLHMNVRTVQRRLEQAGVSFRTILSESRRRRALLELRESQRPVSEVAGRLGYSDPAHFVRAFRRWTGRTPSEYRRMVSGRGQPRETS